MSLIANFDTDRGTIRVAGEPQRHAAHPGGQPFEVGALDVAAASIGNQAMAQTLRDRLAAEVPEIELMRAVYASGTPAFGSCWGVQVGAVAARGRGGEKPHRPPGGV